VDDVDQSPHLRGHNVVVLDQKTGVVKARKNYDTWGVCPKAGEDMNTFLKSITRGDIVLVAAQDSHEKCVDNAKDGLTYVGSSSKINLGVRGSYALVGCAGCSFGSESFQREKSATSGNGPSIVESIIPIACDGVCVQYDPTPTSVQSVAVVLGGEPSSEVQVFINIEGSGSGTDKCILTFSAENWNQPQVVKAVPVITPGAGNTRTIINFSVINSRSDSAFHNKEASATLQQKLHAPAVCSSRGDPHLKTFDGLRYDQYSTGTYYLVRDTTGTLVVQARQAPFHKNSRVTSNHAVVIKYGSSVISFVGKPGQQKLNVKVLSDGLDNGVQVTNVGSRYTVSLPDGSFLRLQYFQNYRHKVVYINIDVKLSGLFFNSVTGLCGNFDDVRGNEFDGLDPKKKGNLDTLGLKVASGNNLFYYPEQDVHSLSQSEDLVGLDLDAASKSVS